MLGGGDPLPLGARGMIGDTATAALVTADGTVDWWCPGRFDAPAALFRILDPGGGGLRVGPAGEPRAGTQSYDEGTFVLRTVLPAPDGEVEVADLMPWDGRHPGRRIVRVVTARRGRVDVEVEVVPGIGFGAPRKVATFSEGVAFDDVVVRAGCPVEGLRGQARLEAGDHLVVSVDGPRTTGEALSVDAALDLAGRTASAWRAHLAPLVYDGPFRPEVERSLLVLRALTSGATGAVVAAPTASLPRRVGGERNFDHRYAWLRDAALAVEATSALGLAEEADRIARWLVHVLEGADHHPLRPVYDVDGAHPADEEELGGLAGWRRSQPVRVGHAVPHLQLDLHADLMATLDPAHARPGTALEEIWDAFCDVGDWLEDGWRQPDCGIWEIRSAPRHLVASKLSCWYALDRMADLAWAHSPLDLAAVGWKAAANEILEWVEEHGLDHKGGCRRDDSREDVVDAALLRVAWRGPWPANHPRVVATVERVLADLSTGAFVHPYPPEVDDGLPPGQGASLACSFWAVRALAALGRWDEAHERMEALCGSTWALGLLPEQADPATGDFLGNLPHALSHLALLGAARALAAGPR